MIYTVKSVRGPKQWTGKYGPMLSYILDLEWGDEELARGVELNRKPESRAPEVGERLAGELEEGKYADKLRIDFDQTKELAQPQTRPQPSSQPQSTTSGPSNLDRSIARQVALKVLGPTINAATSLNADIKRRITEIQEDILSQAANSGQEQLNSSDSGVSMPSVSADPPSGTPAQNSPPAEPDNDHRLDEKLNDAGVTTGRERAWLIKQFHEVLDDAQQKACEVGIVLGAVEDQERAVKRLKELAGPIPSGFKPDDDIPF